MKSAAEAVGVCDINERTVCYGDSARSEAVGGKISRCAECLNFKSLKSRDGRIWSDCQSGKTFGAFASAMACLYSIKKSVAERHNNPFTITLQEFADYTNRRGARLLHERAARLGG